MKKKLLVILGAGSSVSCKMPSVASLDELIRKWSHAWATLHESPDYFALLYKSIETYYLAAKSSLRPPLNFEKVLGEMVALSHWMIPKPWGNTLRQTACDGAPPPHLNFPVPAEHGPSIAVRDQLSYLLIELAKHMRGQCQTIDPAADAMTQYGRLIGGLRRAFDVGIYNLNYDTLALTAWPDAYTGFGMTGTFEADAVHKRQEWGFVYHLHGSVHQSLVGPFGNRIEWRHDLGGRFDDGHPGRSDDDRSEGKPFPTTTLIAGGFKLDQLLVEPFHSLYASLVRHVYEADAILIGGYGFADVHVNRALRNRLAHAGNENRLPVVVLDYAHCHTDPMAFRCDLWAHELCQTLAASGDFFFEPGHASPPRPAELATRNAFEVSAQHRIALWHGGFVKACSRLDGIVPWLLGADDDALVSCT